MKPVVVMPLNDPDGRLFPHMRAITPQLKQIFDRGIVSVTATTLRDFPQHIAWLDGEPFFQAVYHDEALPVGRDFEILYAEAAATCPSDQVLHLCFPDRIAYALQTRHRPHFIADVGATAGRITPLMFRRSAAAWATHPGNYYELEQMVTQVGEMLFGRSIDFAWCHLVIPAGLLRQVMPHIQRQDLSMMAEMALQIREQLHFQAVDWLAWEDPFILGSDANTLKAAREQSVAEVRKRLVYVLPMLDLLRETAMD